MCSVVVVVSICCVVSWLVVVYAYLCCYAYVVVCMCLIYGYGLGICVVLQVLKAQICIGCAMYVVGVVMCVCC